MTSIRQLEPSDVSACVQVGIGAHRPVYASMEDIYGTDLFECLRPNWENTLSSLIEEICADAANHAWVAVSDGAVTGFAVARSDGDTRLAHIEMVAVDLDRQNRGIGTLLLGFAIDHLKHEGMVYAEAFTRGFPGHHPARHTFGKVGFTSMPIQPEVLFASLDSNSPRTDSWPGIRRVAPDDITECVRFGLETFRPVFASFKELYGDDLFHRLRPDWENAQSAYIESACKSAEDETWVHEVDGVAAGFVVLQMTDSKLGAIDLLAVDPDQQGRGVGTALNEFAVSRLAEAGMTYAVVSTGNDPSHAAARRSYQKASFAPMPIQWDLLVASL